MNRGLLLLTLGVWACSTAVIFIKVSTMPAEVLAAWRLLLAAAVLAPLALRFLRGADPAMRRFALLGTLLPGLALAVHFLSWTYGARLTETARAALVVNMAPLVMPFALWLVARERISRGEWLGTGIALAGALVLTLPRLTWQQAPGWGEAVCFGSTCFLALYLALGRRYRASLPFWAYLALVYSWAALACLPVAMVMHPGAWWPAADQWGWLALLVLVPTLVGHGLLTHAVRTLGGQLASVGNLGQAVFAGAMAVPFFGEWPDAWFYPGAALIAWGAWVAVRSPRSGAISAPAPPLRNRPDAAGGRG